MDLSGASTEDIEAEIMRRGFTREDIDAEVTRRIASRTCPVCGLHPLFWAGRETGETWCTGCLRPLCECDCGPLCADCQAKAG